MTSDARRAARAHRRLRARRVARRRADRIRAPPRDAVPTAAREVREPQAVAHRPRRRRCRRSICTPAFARTCPRGGNGGGCSQATVVDSRAGARPVGPAWLAVAASLAAVALGLYTLTPPPAHRPAAGTAPRRKRPCRGRRARPPRRARVSRSRRTDRGDPRSAGRPPHRSRGTGVGAGRARARVLERQPRPRLYRQQPAAAGAGPAVSALGDSARQQDAGQRRPARRNGRSADLRRARHGPGSAQSPSPSNLPAARPSQPATSSCWSLRSSSDSIGVRPWSD